MKKNLKLSIIWLVIIAVIYGILIGLINAGVINEFVAQIITQIGINLIVAVGLNLVIGFTGQFSFGQLVLWQSGLIRLRLFQHVWHQLGARFSCQC